MCEIVFKHFCIIGVRCVIFFPFNTLLLIYFSGVLLRMLQVEGNLEGVSHIFVDEVKLPCTLSLSTRNGNLLYFLFIVVFLLGA